MRKISAVLMFVLVTAVFGASPVQAEPPVFFPPVPSRSAVSQTGVGVIDTKTDATNLMFFDHATAPSGNFRSNFVTIGGRDHYVRDLVATPGLLTPGDRTIDENSSMFYSYGRIGVTMGAIQGFCPGTFESADGSSVTLDCQVGGADPAVYESRQLQVADIRNALAPELPLLTGQDPVVSALIGSSGETTAPYNTATYPSTIISRDKVTMRENCVCDPEHPERCRWVAQNERKPVPYDEVVAYGVADLSDGVADLSAGIVTAPYDTFFITEKIWPSYLLRPRTWPYMSPLAFYIKDGISSRMRLDGYSASEIRSFFGGRLFDEYVFGLGVPLETNINPIAVVSMDVGSSKGFAVVNQSTIVDLNAYVTLNGVPYLDPSNGVRYAWADYFKLPDGGEIDAFILPHRVVSYVTFWKEDNSLGWGNGARYPDSFNPNSSFKAVGASLVGPGMFSAAKVTDIVDGAEKERLVVPSGEPTGTGEYYIYKVDPQSEEKLKVMMRERDELSVGGRPLPLQTVLAKPTRVSQTPAGFAPYGIACGDPNGDGCGDCAITFRGAQTIPVALEGFSNAKGQHVVFRANPEDPTMFSNSVLIYYGKRDGAECVFADARANRQMIDVNFENPAQIAAVAIGDVDGNGKDDLVVGDLVPREIDGRTGIFAAHAYLYLTGDDGEFTSLTSPQKILVGFKTTNGAVTAEELFNIVKGLESEKIAGVAALALDENGEGGANIGAINGIPLMLPTIGCTEFAIAGVYSLGEMLMTGAAAPSRCGGSPGTPDLPGGGPVPGMPGGDVRMDNPKPQPDDDTQFAYRSNFKDSQFPRNTGVKFAQLGGLQQKQIVTDPGNAQVLGTKSVTDNDISDSNSITSSDAIIIREGLDVTGEDSFYCVRGSPDRIFDPLSIFHLPTGISLDSSNMPRGQVMPGPREMTWVVKYVPYVPEPPPEVVIKTRLPRCGDPVPPPGCPAAPPDPVPPPPPPPATGGTTTTADVPVVEVLPPQPPPPPPEIQMPVFRNDCTSRVITYSGNVMKEKVEGLNKNIREITGRSDDLFVEPGQMMCFFCRFEDALTPEGEVSLAANKSAIPAPANNINPSVFVQTGGAELVYLRGDQYKAVRTLKQPQIISPIDAESNAASKAITAQLLASATGVIGIPQDAVLMPIETTARLSGGGFMINNMIEMRNYIVPVDKPFTINMGTGITLESGAPAITVQNAPEMEGIGGAAILSYCITQPWDYASFTGLEGYTGAPNIEDRKLDVSVVSDELKTRVKEAPDGKPTSDIYYGLTWEDSLNLRHIAMIDTALGPVTRKMASLEVPQGMFADGAGCKSCKNSITGLPPSLDSVFPTAVSILFALSGIVAGRIRGRKRR